MILTGSPTATLAFSRDTLLNWMSRSIEFKISRESCFKLTVSFVSLSFDSKVPVLLRYPVCYLRFSATVSEGHAMATDPYRNMSNWRNWRLTVRSMNQEYGSLVSKEGLQNAI